MEGLPIVSPLTGTICTWYEYKIEEHRQSGKNSRWDTIKKGTSDELFLIKDETGQCIIDPEGAHVTVNHNDVWYGATAHPSRGSLGSSSNRFFKIGSMGRYRYTEKRLQTSEELYAIGLYKTVGGAGATFNINKDVRELIREWKTDT